MRRPHPSTFAKNVAGNIEESSASEIWGDISTETTKDNAKKYTAISQNIIN